MFSPEIQQSLLALSPHINTYFLIGAAFGFLYLIGDDEWAEHSVGFVWMSWLTTVVFWGPILTGMILVLIFGGKKLEEL